jgi:glucose-1-phosphate adenylyltransferase
MLLAGGQGSRLGYLTGNIAKPGLSFGGKYRIIDFSLSNCVNSNIDTVGVLTQYKPWLLNAYLGIGSAWDLDFFPGGLHILPPYVGELGGRWYKGTANAIYENIDFINYYNPDYVLIISGDHIYKMNYNEMIRAHKEKQADLTISVLRVPPQEASRFGIMTTDADSRILRFMEKPVQPESDLASMGVYIFNWPVLKEALIADETDSQSDHDFGKNIIPMLLALNKEVYAYQFNGYWKDVGTVKSYFEANMELLEDEPGLNIFDNTIRVFSNSEVFPPQYSGAQALVRKSLVCNGCTILGEVMNSVVGPGVYIGEGARVENSILLPNSRIASGAEVRKTIIGEEAVVGSNCSIGVKTGANLKQSGITVIADKTVIGPDFCVEAGRNINGDSRNGRKRYYEKGYRYNCQQLSE